jgi:iron complex outermembrane receptor protein
MSPAQGVGGIMRKHQLSAGTFIGAIAFTATSQFYVSAANAEDKLEEVVITAERRTEDLQKSAASISVRSGQDMAQQGRYSLKSILEDVPGLSGGAAELVSTSGAVGSDTAGAGLTIRGIQSNVGVGGSITSSAAAAALYVDGVYEGVGGSYDIDRVEVLRGPQGTLYGRSATSGVVALHTRNPDLTKFGVNASVEGGNYNLRHYTAGVDIPFINDVLGLRLAGNYYDRDGFINGKDGAAKNEDAKAKLLFKPSEDFSLLIGIAGQNNATNTGGIGVTQSATRDDVILARTDTAVAYTRFRQYWAETKLNVGIGTLTYLPAYRTYWQDAAVAGGANPAFRISQKALTPTDYFWTHELRLSSNPDSKLIWQIGGLYYNNKLENSNTVRNENLNVLAFSAETAKTTKASGLFAQATWPFTDALRLTGGIRYDSTKVEVAEAYTANPTIAPGYPGPPSDCCNVTAYLSGDAGTRKFNNMTYKVRLDYDLTPSSLVYASVSTGFSPGDVSLTTCPPSNAPCVLPLEAETLTSYEMGSKNRFLDDKLQLNSAVFYYDYGAYQVQNIDVSPVPGNPQFLGFSVPVTSYGLELELLYQLTANDRISLDGSYTNASYHDKTALFTSYVYEDKLTTVGGSGGAAVPPVSATLSWDHLVNLPGGSTLNLRASGRYSSSRKGHLSAADAAIGGEQYVNIDAQTIGDVNMAWTSPQRHYTVSAYCRNVGDNDYINNVRLDRPSVFPPPAQAPTASGFYFTQGQYDPRTYGVIFGVNF